VTVRTWDGATEGSADIYLAKEWKLRCTLTGETIFGIPHTYTYGAGPDGLNVQRTNDDGTHSETEIVVPPWVPDEIVYGVASMVSVLTIDDAPIKDLLIRNAQWAKYP